MNEVERENSVLSCKLTVEPSILIIHTIPYRTRLNEFFNRKLMNKYFIICTFIFWASGTSNLLGQKMLRYRNSVYEPTIKTVQLYPKGNTVQTMLDPAVREMGETQPLILEFDDLKNNADYYFVYFVHCNANWKPSDLRPGMYLNVYNEFEIENFEFSSESKINYVHYTFQFPSFKQTGNYLAIVYRDRKKEDIILSRRFSIYRNVVSVGGTVGISLEVSKRLKNQRVEVTLNYNGLRSMNPSKDFTVVVRQNQRPDQTKTALEYTFIDENAKTIRYQNPGLENDFPGGNEFRAFDISTVNFTGHNVAKIGFEDNRAVAELLPDKPRRSAFFQMLDINGNYYTRDLENNTAPANPSFSVGQSGKLTAEYVRVRFSLQYPKSNRDIYILGAFNQWQKDENARLKFDAVTGMYHTTQLLKQGWYNYTYIVDSRNPQLIEGSFFETENLYEIFVYFRPMGARGDKLVGYRKIDYNSGR